MKEAKLKIDIDGIIKACKSINSADAMKEYVAGENKISHLFILKYILKDNLKIESDEHSEEEREDILDIVKNNIYRYFIDATYEVEDMDKLHEALKTGKSAPIESEAISLIDKFVKPNPFIYSAKHGIRRKNNTDEDESTDPSTRTYTLEIDDANTPPNLKSLARFTSAGIDGLFLNYIFNLLLQSARVLKNYSDDSTYYTLDKLYSTTYEDTGVPLVDYGLSLFCEKYYKIAELVEKIREMETNKASREDIVGKIRKVLSPEELSLLFSIKNDIPKIVLGKKLQNSMIKAVEYAKSDIPLLTRTDGLDILDINTNLSKFYERYITANTASNADINISKLEKKVEKKTQALEEKRRKYDQAVKKKDRKETEKTTRSINVLKNDIYLLECDIKRVKLQSNNIYRLLYNIKYTLPILNPVQKKCIIEKVEEFRTIRRIKAVEDEINNTVYEEVIEDDEVNDSGADNERKPTSAEIVKILVLGAILIVVTVLLLNSFSKNRIKVTGTN
ncbi:hypothetical protein NEMIN01_1747 [Nematocida minor]|uniref:uncharacterized protein n=1 Tax=Nematocida minor TaxID=1912983 RepID=UPI00221E9C82|nr:uncharacterized protein NEMIN01_1747 [Nematocida minor]KAI5191929.1 hypothetical protein NEMIN01_1747 [Nematocida minor]